MRVVTKLSLGAALLGSLVAFSAAAQANDWDHRWDRDHDHYRHERVIEHRVVEERPVYVHEHRPVIVERPVMMAPPVVYAPPQGPSGLNLNFNIPLN
jgi:hypothetical protein